MTSSNTCLLCTPLINSVPFAELLFGLPTRPPGKGNLRSVESSNIAKFSSTAIAASDSTTPINSLSSSVLSDG